MPKWGIKLNDRVNFMAGKTLFQSRIKIAERPEKGKPKPPDTIEKIHLKWFYSLEPKHYAYLQKEWNDNKLKVEIEMQEGYDAWLNYFKNMPPNAIKLLATTGMDLLPTEGYAALSRWHDIISNPARIDKIHQAGLTSKGGKDTKTIAQLALDNDRYGVLCATRDKLAEKLDKGAGTRDTALIVREMTEVMTQIADYQKRLGPKKETKLGQLLDDMPVGKKRPSKNGGGARNGSFKSRVTIKDLENA